MSATTPLCLHHDDRDGDCAAWVVRQLHPNVECVAVNYGDPVPARSAVGRVVYVVDFSWPLEQLFELEVAAARLTVIDHHRSAQSTLLKLKFNGAGTTRIVYDNDRSGCGLTWDTLFPDERRPWFVDYVEDRDSTRTFRRCLRVRSTFNGCHNNRPRRTLSLAWVALCSPIATSSSSGSARTPT
jgi:oligoribonuclease NrnB/cAMP/cGMP phosphodiesterase (DHH superfamily)